MAVSEERVVITAELQDELSAPLQRVEQNLINSTANMINAGQRQATQTARTMTQVSNTMTTSSSAATNWGRTFQQVTSGSTTAFSQMQSSIGSSGNLLQRGWNIVSSAASQMGTAVSSGFSTAVRASEAARRDIVTGVESMARTMASVGSNVGRTLGDGFKTAASVATAAFATISGLAISGGLSRMLNIEDAQAKLLGLGNSVTDVAQMMEDANTAVSGTAYGLDQAATVAAMAASAGIKPGQEMAKYLTLVADAATIAGTDLSEMGDIMGDIVTAGAVTGGALNRFQIRGVGVTQMLAKSFGKTTKEIDEMVSAGEISVEQFTQVLTEGLGGAAQKSGETTRGALKNMRAALSRTGEAMLTGFMPIAKVTFGAVTDGLNALNKMVKPVMSEFGTQFTEKATPAIKAWGEKTVQWLERAGLAISALSDVLIKGDFNGKFVKAFGVEEDSQIVDFLFDIREGFMALEPVMAPVAAGFAAAFGGLLKNLPLIGPYLPTLNPLLAIFLGLLVMSPELRESLMSVFEALAPVIATVMDALAPLLPIIVDLVVNLVDFAAVLIDKIAPFLPELLLGFAALWGAIKLLDFWNKAAAATTTILGAAQAGYQRATGVSTVATEAQTVALNRNKWALLANKSAYIGTSIAMGLATAATWLFNGAMIVLSALTSPIGLIVLAIVGIVAGLILAYNKVGWFKDGVDAVIAWIVDAFNNSVDWIVGAWSNITDWWNETLLPALQKVGDFFKMIWDKVVVGVEIAGNLIRFAIAKIVDWWDETLMPALQKVGDFFSMIWDGIVAGVKFYIGIYVAIFNVLVDFWQGVLWPALQKVGDFFSDVFEYVKTLVLNFVAVAVAIFQHLASFWETHILPGLQKLGDGFMSILTWINETVIQPIVQGAIDLFNGLVTFWNETLIPAVQWLGDKFMEIMTWINETIIQPLVEGAIVLFDGLVVYWNERLVPAVQWLGDKFLELLTWINESIIQPIVGAIVWAFDGLVGFWNNTLIPSVQAVGDFFAFLWNWVNTNVIQPVIGWIIEKFNGLVSFWNNTLLPVIQTVGDWFRDKIGAGIDVAKDAIQKAKDGFQVFINFWKDKLQPVVDGIRAAFEKVGEVIGGAVGGLKDFASNPFGGLQDLLGVEKDGNGNGVIGTSSANGSGGMVVPGYSGGGVVPGFAGGGIIPGYAPGVDNFNAVLSPGESVLVPELTRAIGAGNIMALNAQYSGGRRAGAGPSPSVMSSARETVAAGASSSSSVVIGEGAVQLVFTGEQAGTPEDIAAKVADALQELMDDIERKSY